MACWLVKSEAETYSIEDLRRDRITRWDCVRNYQARNNLCTFAIGEKVLFYRSVKNPGVVGEAEVVKLAYPDPLQFDNKSDYFDSTAKRERPRWFSPDLIFVRAFSEISLERLKSIPSLKNMALFKSSRLSVQPVSDKEYKTIIGLVRVE